MSTVLRLMRANRLFAGIFLLFLLVSLISCACYSKSHCFIMLNSLHSSMLDYFFIYYTILGDGWLALILFLGLLLFRRLLQSFQVLAAYLSSGMAAQVIKYLSPAPRPKVFFQPEQYAYFIEGITRGGWSSFPSGHTTTAFAVATVLALHAQHKWMGIGYLLLAIGVGYSRIYLGSHFLEDVIAGAILGVIFGTVSVMLLQQVKFLDRFQNNAPSSPAVMG